MNNRDGESKVLNKSMLVLVVLFIATILQDVTTGTLNLTWVMFMGTIVVGLALSTLLLSGRTGDNKLNEH